MAKTVALIFGIIYTVIGVAGFIAPLGGTLGMEPSVVLGIAQINLVHNIVHLAIGFAGLSAASDDLRAVAYCQWVGVILIVLALLGFFVTNPFGLVPIGGNDPWIHLVSGAILAFVGFRSAAASRA